MKVVFDFEELASVLGYVNLILADKSVEDSVKNIIFLVKGDEVTVVGYNPLTFSRTVLEKTETVSIPENGWEFQLKASELNKIFQAYSNLYKTVVHRVSMEDDGVRIKVTVHEEPIDADKDAKLAQDCTFEVENRPILSKVLTDVRSEFPEETDSVVSSELLLYLSALLPLMSNDSANSTASKLNFAEDYVFTLSSSTSAFFKNKLPDTFKGISLGYSSVGFMKKVCEGNESISIAKNTNYICIEAGNTQAFLRYKPIKINYKAWVEKKSKEKGIVVDRLYLKDVLRRMNSVSPEGVMLVENGETLVVSNEVFRQEVPLENCKPSTEGVKFKVSIPILISLILGSDDIFADSLYIYFVETNRGYNLYFQDKSGAWFSNAQVAKA